MVNPHGLHRLILEAVREQGRVDMETLPGFDHVEVTRLVVELHQAKLLGTDWKGHLWVTERGLVFLAQVD